MFDKQDVETTRDIDSRCAGWRRPPGMKMKRVEDLNPFVTAIKNMLQQIPSAFFHRPSKHSRSVTHGAWAKTIEKRRARNKVARRSRRINRLYA